jgi:beta-glucosidase
MIKPSSELKAFGKTRLLNPGESQTLSFTLHSRDLASFDTATSSWIAEAGEYAIYIGASSRDIRQTGRFTNPDEKVVEKVSKSLVPQKVIEEINIHR